MNPASVIDCKQLDKELYSQDYKKLENISFSNLTLRCRVVNVYDGDTITVVFQYIDNKFYKYNVRLSGIDTPELKSTKGEEIKLSEYEKELGLKVKEFLKEAILEKICVLKCDLKQADMYGRILGTLYDKEENINYNKLLIDKDYAKPYFGGTKADWNKDKTEDKIVKAKKRKLEK